MTSTNDAPVTPYDGCGRCLLGVRRLSQVSRATSSPARQRDLILDTAEREGAHIVAWADDATAGGAKVNRARIALDSRRRPHSWVDLSALPGMA